MRLCLSAMLFVMQQFILATDMEMESHIRTFQGAAELFRTVLQSKIFDLKIDSNILLRVTSRFVFHTHLSLVKYDNLSAGTQVKSSRMKNVTRVSHTFTIGSINNNHILMLQINDYLNR